MPQVPRGAFSASDGLRRVGPPWWRQHALEIGGEAVGLGWQELCNRHPDSGRVLEPESLAGSDARTEVEQALDAAGLVRHRHPDVVARMSMRLDAALGQSGDRGLASLLIGPRGLPYTRLHFAVFPKGNDELLQHETDPANSGPLAAFDARAGDRIGRHESESEVLGRAL